jgi:hypothetical protein
MPILEAKAGELSSFETHVMLLDKSSQAVVAYLSNTEKTAADGGSMRVVDAKAEKMRPGSISPYHVLLTKAGTSLHSHLCTHFVS